MCGPGLGTRHYRVSWLCPESIKLVVIVTCMTIPEPGSNCLQRRAQFCPLDGFPLLNGRGIQGISVALTQGMRLRAVKAVTLNSVSHSEGECLPYKKIYVIA